MRCPFRIERITHGHTGKKTEAAIETPLAKVFEKLGTSPRGLSASQAKVRVYHHFGMETTRHQNFLRVMKQSLHHHGTYMVSQ